MPKQGAEWRPSPAVEWAIREAWRLRNPRRLAEELSNRLIADGVPLWRFGSYIPARHPELFGDAYLWRRDVGRAEYFAATHEYTESETFQTSPLHVVRETREMFRRRLVGPDARLDFPLLEKLKAEGGTDYVILPFEFNDGLQRGGDTTDSGGDRLWWLGYATYAADAPGGFSDCHIEILRDMTMAVARVAENLAIQAETARFLDIYVGRDAGRRILDGQIMRGSGETIHAAVAFFDLRGFTALSDTLPRETLIDLLNGFFDRVAGPVKAADGEILKFIGDAVLAIFPVTDERDAMGACRAALKAATDTVSAMAAFNAERAAAGEGELGFRVTLHVGDVMYGNIGSSDRLDFTVIGPAVNVVNRMQGICRDLDRQVLVSAAFATEAALDDLVPLGSHPVRGVAEPLEVFGLDG